MCLAASQTVGQPGRRVWGHRSVTLASRRPAVRTPRTSVPVSTPSLAARAAVVATGTTAAALLTLLPAAPPVPAPTAVAATSPDGRGGGPFAGGHDRLHTTQATRWCGAAREGRWWRAAATPATPGACRPPSPLAGRPPARARQARRTGGGRAARQRDGDRDEQARLRLPLGRRGPRRLRLLRPRLLVLPPGGPHRCRAPAGRSRRSARPSSKGALQPGDLVFFYRPVSHVAIYIGNGRVVHASTAGSR